MPSLLEIERQFQHGLLGGDVPLDQLCADSAIGFEVYRNNVASNFREALRDTYPAIERLVGEPFFAHLARQYALAVPSTSGTLDDFGAAFAAFVADFPAARELVYLPDVARLEWALHQVFHAAERPAFDVARLSRFGRERLARAQLVLAPAASLIASSYPLLEIWNLASGTAPDAATVDLAAGPDHLLVLRDADLQARVHRLGAATFTLLSWSARGARIETALAEALAIDVEFDFAHMLVEHAGLGTIVDVRHT